MIETEKRIFDQLLKKGLSALEIMEILGQLRDLAIESSLESDDEIDDEFPHDHFKSLLL